MSPKTHTHCNIFTSKHNKYQEKHITECKLPIQYAIYISRMNVITLLWSCSDTTISAKKHRKVQLHSSNINYPV